MTLHDILYSIINEGLNPLGFWPLRVGGVWVNPWFEKGKIFFYNVEWSCENLWKMISPDVKANLKQK